MIEVVEVLAPAVAVSIESVTTGFRICDGIILQAAAANAANVNFGSRAKQAFFLVPGGDIFLPGISTKNVFFSGNGTDYVTIGKV